MKFTIFTAVGILILQSTSVINITSMYSKITDKYGTNLEKLFLQKEFSKVEQASWSSTHKPAEKLEARF